jgi:holo-[acyl-carrier protein] synthase
VRVQVGIDLVRTDEVRASLAAHGERYLKRIYTDVEQREAGRNPRRLAARFAAKEATFKAMKAGRDALPWSSIGVCEVPGGRLSVQLTGEAAELADRRGVRHLQVSFAYRGPVAAAIVVAELEETQSDATS